MNQRTRILVVDDHPFFRRGLVEWLNRQSEFLCCGEADSVAHAQEAIVQLKPDVVLLDLQLKDGDGLDLILSLLPREPTLRIIVLSHRDESIYAHRALRAGARGYVMKTEATDSVRSAILCVMKGEVYVSRTVAARALQKLFPDPTLSCPDLDKLSDRELQVFQLLGARCGTKEISITLKISHKTVETYRESLKRKLQLTDAEGLVRAARQWVDCGRLELPGA